jgi:hypothetical protein
VTKLEHEVLGCVRANPGLSGRSITAKVGRRKQDVLKALKSLEERETVKRTRKGYETVPRGSRKRSDASTARSARSSPDTRISITDADLAELVEAVERLDQPPGIAGRLRRNLERRRERQVPRP